MTLLRVLVLMLLTLAWPSVLSAQRFDHIQDCGAECQEALQAMHETLGDMYGQLVSLRAASGAGHTVFSEEGFSQYQAAHLRNVLDYVEYQIFLRGHAQKVLWWHLLAAYFLVVTVILVVGAGVGLAIYEVWRSHEAAKAKPRDANLPETTVTLSAQSVQITSAVTGVAVLVISLGFLFLFVERVFKLEPQDWLGQSAPLDGAAQGAGEPAEWGEQTQ